MLPIQGLRCIYDTGARSWAIELVLGGEGDLAQRRFEVDGAEDAEMLIEAFDDSTAATFDPVTGEIVFAYEYADFDDEDEEEDDDLDDEDAADETDDPDEEKGKA